MLKNYNDVTSVDRRGNQQTHRQLARIDRDMTSTHTQDIYSASDARYGLRKSDRIGNAEHFSELSEFTCLTTELRVFRMRHVG